VKIAQAGSGSSGIPSTNGDIRVTPVPVPNQKVSGEAVAKMSIITLDNNRAEGGSSSSGRRPSNE
jgi:hypothetical protein